MNSVNKITDFYINARLKENGELHMKARVFVWLHLFLMVLIGLSYVVKHFFAPESNFPQFTAFLLIFSTVLFFKYKGSFFLSGNLLAIVIAFLTFPMSLNTGGLYSYDFICMLIVPIIAFYLAGFRSGLVWSVLLFGVLGLFYYLELHPAYNFIRPTDIFKPEYFLGIIFFAFCIPIGIVAIMTKGQSIILKKLNEKREELERNKLELEAVQRQLQESNLELEKFAHITSHDLRQPLRTINSFGQLLKRELGEDLSERRREFLDYILQGSNDLQVQISAILNYSTLKNKQEQKEWYPIEVHKMLDKVIAKLDTQISEVHAEIRLDNLPKTIIGNELKLSLVFQNLISNALKFRNPNRPIELIISGTETEDFWKFEVKDNGLGIEGNMLERIFEMDVKSNSNINVMGTGMGLATCRKLVEQHGGTITASSKKDQGTCFTFGICKAIEETQKQEFDVQGFRKEVVV